jgi:hypothetical protein
MKSKQGMKNSITLLSIVLLAFSSCKLSNSKPDVIDAQMITQKTTMTFDKEVFTFGEMTQGETVDFEFKFTNTGDSPLVIVSVQPSCGCTITEDWPDYPIAPGEGGVIPVQFNSERKQGHQSKSITLVANTKPRTHILMIEGDIIAPEVE